MMEKVKKIPNYIHNPEKMIAALGSRDLLNFMDDRTYLNNLYKATMEKELNLDNPQKFNEKIQWLKLYDRNPKYTQYVDKYGVREYIREKIGSEYLIPLLGVWDEFVEIDFSELPQQFVLKTTHDSGGVIVCRDKSKLDKRQAKNKINKSLKSNYYYRAREWPYKNVKPRIIAEKLLVDESGTSLKDFKFLCFNGEAKVIQVMSDRSEEGFYLNHYDTQWNELDIPRKNHEKNKEPIEKPSHLKEMLEIAEHLSTDIPFVRVDLYYINNKIYFGELTFYPVSGHMRFVNEEDDYLLGSWIELTG